jgi:hypothetical protein
MEGGTSVFEGVRRRDKVDVVVTVGLGRVIEVAMCNCDEVGRGSIKEVGLVGCGFNEEVASRNGEHLAEFLGLVIGSLGEK